MPLDGAVPRVSWEVLEIAIFVSAPFQFVMAENNKGAGVALRGVVTISGVSESPSVLRPTGPVKAQPLACGNGHEAMT